MSKDGWIALVLVTMLLVICAMFIVPEFVGNACLKKCRDGDVACIRACADLERVRRLPAPVPVPDVDVPGDGGR